MTMIDAGTLDSGCLLVFIIRPTSYILGRMFVFLFEVKIAICLPAWVYG